MQWWLKKQFLRLKLYAFENYQNEAESLVIWYAVCYALGMAFYMALPWELPIWLVVVYLEAILLLLYIYRRKEGIFKLLTYMAVFALGICIAKADAVYRKNNLETEMPKISYLHGYVEDITPTASGRQRLILSYADNFEHELKGKFSISVREKKPWLKKGICLELVAELPKSYAQNPLGNYNFERYNFYKGISASGYAISPIFESMCEEKPSKIKQIIEEIRAKISSAANLAAPNESAIIKALTIGDRSTISKEQARDYRNAGLAHLLAISGMHMGLIALLVFFLMRLILLPLGYGHKDWRRVAALISLIMAFGYFLISGQSVSCVRAFMMTSFVLLAVMLNRRPISQRLWAFAVLIVATLNPSAVISPGFLMSFSAVLGIIAFYEKNASRLYKWYAARNMVGKIGAYVMGVIITDLVASLMTLPFSIYYFHQVSVYTTLGNVLAAPIIAFWVMPMLLLFLLSIPFGGAAYTIKLLASGVEVINQIASWVSSLAGAKIGESVGMMPEWGILIITLGILWLCIWQERWRLLGFVIIFIGCLSLWTVLKPDFVFDAKGNTFACRSDMNKMVITPWHKNKFLISQWTSVTPEKKEKYDTSGLSCHKQSCICQNRIEFSKHHVKLDGKEINLDYGGYINLKENKVYYKIQAMPRLWD